MDIVIVSQYLRDIEHLENNNSRFIYIAGMLRDRNCSVEIITSDFNHSVKRHFRNVGVSEKIRITALHEPGYPKNVCLKRFSSHRKLSESIRSYLYKRTKPDVVYAAVPSLDTANVCAEYCNSNHVRFIVDIQDLWPEAFKMIFHVPVLSNLIFAPMNRKADYIYSLADEIVGVSKTYTERALKVNKKCRKGHTVFLGTKLETFDNNAESNSVTDKKERELWLAYCGTLGASYDLTIVFDALDILRKKKVNVPKFIVMGDGPRKEEFESYAESKNSDVVFTGRMSYDKMCGMLCSCDIAVNPITKGAAQSIINKHADYAASGLPVLNTQECTEYKELIENYHMGFNCENNNAQNLADNLQILIENESLRKEMGKNSRRCAEEKFDREKTYIEIIDLFGV